MRNCLLILFSLLGTLFMVSCESNDHNAEQEKVSKNLQSKGGATAEDPVKIVIFEASWDSWGRTSKNCDGFGLCEFSICWFCCFDANDNRVPCKEGDSGMARKSYRAKINSETKIGELTIPLSMDTPKEIEAIQTEGILYVDEDLIQPELTIHAGEYIFDNSVGTLGGYKVKVSIP